MPHKNNQDFTQGFFSVFKVLIFFSNTEHIEGIIIRYCINTREYCTKPIFCGTDAITDLSNG